MKKGIILTSFGTTYKETLEKNIETLEKLVRDNFEDYLVLRAFTSRIVAKRLKERGYDVDNPTQALEKMKEQGIKEIYIQPSLIIEGHEYDKTHREVKSFLEENTDFTVKVGLPLLSSDKDYENAVEALDIPELDENNALIYMGHGSDHTADLAYEKIENVIRSKGYNNVFVGTVEGEVEIEDIIERLDDEIKYVELKPFMLVAGDHATNDMASDEEDSWKSKIEEKGIEVKATLVGLGESEKIRNIFLSHLKDIM